MIADKIADAKRAKTQLLLKTILLLLTLTLFAAGLLFWASLPKTPKTVEGIDAPEIAKSSLQPAESEQNSSELRQAYLEAFAYFENTVKPSLNKIDLQQWDSALAQQLKTKEAQAIEQFGSSYYAQANNTLNALINKAESAIEQSEKQFEAAMQAAQSAFDDNDYPPAKAEINKALMLDSQSEAAQRLADRIAQLPEITELVEKIRIAQAEKALQRELDLIRSLLKLTPERESYKQRAVMLQETLNNNTFQSLISQSYRALESQNSADARAALNRARAIYPNRVEINDVNRAIQQLEQNQRLDNFWQQARVAESNDDWPGAQQALEQILSEKPNDKAAATKLSLANTIVALAEQVDQALASPYRLSNTTVHDSATSTLQAARSVQQHSPSLTGKTRQLESIITMVNTPVAVTVNSDNQTYISVRGVGNVGVVDSKVIQLKPGQYTFEGKRTGYKSKLKEVLIPYEQTQFSLTLVCDEPI